MNCVRTFGRECDIGSLFLPFACYPPISQSPESVSNKRAESSLMPVIKRPSKLISDTTWHEWALNHKSLFEMEVLKRETAALKVLGVYI